MPRSAGPEAVCSQIRHTAPVVSAPGDLGAMPATNPVCTCLLPLQAEQAVPVGGQNLLKLPDVVALVGSHQVCHGQHLGILLVRPGFLGIEGVHLHKGFRVEVSKSGSEITLWVEALLRIEGVHLHKVVSGLGSETSQV